MRKTILLPVAAACLGLGSGLLVLAKPPAAAPAATRPAAEAGDAMTSDTMMSSDTMMGDSMMSGMSGAAHPVNRPLSKVQLDFFESKVRPVLAKNCYQCHSAERRKTKGGLALDTQAGWQKGGEDGKVIVPGNPDKSMLIKAIGYKDNDLQMPPDDKLSDADIAVLTQWVRMGAPDPRVAGPASKLTGLTDKARAHWAYKPLKNPPIPGVHNTTWVKSPVDSFVLAKLEKNDIKPSPPATREALIRRASYDLIGLPPTPEEVEAFVRDTSPDAFAKVVDRLLRSPHFGERWGRYWLDTARYSDTSGADQNRGEYKLPFAWTYRDYVVQSFNADKPYDEFLKEQLAADLLPGPKDSPRLAALGFLTIGKRFANPNDTIDERIDAVGKGMLGLTVSCARCHDHKFDPIPQADYYSLHGVFNSITEPTEKPLIARPAKNDDDYVDFQKKLAELEGKNRDLYYKLIDAKAKEFRKDAAAYVLVGVIGRRNNADEILLRDKTIADHKLDRDVYQYSGRYIRGNFPIFGPILEVAEVPSQQFSQAARGMLEEVKTGKIRKKPLNPVVVKAFAGVAPDSLRSLQDVAAVYGKLFADLSPAADDYLAACRAATRTGPVLGFDSGTVELFDLPAKIEVAADLTTDHLTEIAATLPVVNGQGYNRLNLTEVNQLLLTHPGSPARAMVVEDLPKARNSNVFIRGEANNRGPVAPRQFLEILSGPNRRPFTQGSGRLELANAIADRGNPLTARVMINRIWMHLFGQGFVRTPDDLGVQCEAPSHPELLDYLAHRFMFNANWSVKQTIRLIMLSNTYQQSCDTNPEYAARDSENRLLWRANLRRLDFEAMRDSLLMFTGTLDPKVGGKPVNLTDEPYSNRRSIYGYIDRGTLPELLSQFDFADPDMANSRRTSTIVPQQALFFMNSPMSVDVARKVTTRPEFVRAPDAPARVAALYSVLFQRTPTADEVRFALEFLDAAGGEDDGAAPTTRPLTPAQQRQAKIAQERRARQQQAFEASLRKQIAGKRGGRAPIHNQDGSIVERRPLTAWEQYAQALLFTNEIAYEN